MINTLAWLGWLAAALVASSATRNPLYLIVELLCIAIIWLSLPQDAQRTDFAITPFRFALIVTALSAAFNTLTAHFGETVLFRLPAAIPFLGGPITLEALVFGTLNGLVLSGVFAAFAVMNVAVPISAIITVIPRAFHTSAVIISIAVTFVPNTLRQMREVREAQAVRGLRVRGIRDWLPLFMPMLIGGMEHALQLAEAMASRGFASRKEGFGYRRARLIFALSLLLLLAGWLLRLTWLDDQAGYALMLLGGSGAMLALWLFGRAVPHTTYRTQRWSAADTLVMAAAALTMAGLLIPWPGIDRSSLSYSPYPKLEMPAFEPLFGLVILGLLGPAFASSLLSARPKEQR